MKEKLIKYLEYEEFLLKKLYNLSQKQQDILVKYEIDKLDVITKMQEETSDKLRTAEDMRLELVMDEFGLDEETAKAISVSSLFKYYGADESIKMDKIRKRLSLLMEKLNDININNRVLTNRAMNTTQKILEVLNAPENQVISVKV